MCDFPLIIFATSFTKFARRSESSVDWHEKNQTSPLSILSSLGSVGEEVVSVILTEPHMTKYVGLT